jgi:phage terminase small subunit
MAEETIKRTREELEAILTPKEHAFCWRYIVLRNGGRAAIEAGYSTESCYSIASENLTKPNIKDYIEIIKECIEEATGVSKFRNVEELSKIAYSNIDHLRNDWIELTDWEEIKRNNPTILSAIESIDYKTETKVYGTEGDDEQEVEIKYVKVKLYPKIAAISEINKMMGYNAPIRGEITGKDGKDLIPIKVKIEFGDPNNE